MTDAAVADRIWDWVGNRLSSFGPFAEQQEFTIPAAQRIPELAVAVLAHRRSTLPSHPTLQRAVDAILAASQEPAFMDRLVRSPQEFSLYLDTYALLRQLGHEDFELRCILERAIGAGLIRQSERLPHRVMDIALSLRWADLQAPLPSIDALMRSTLLGALPDAAHMEESALYALTHVILFATAFGIDADPPLRIERSRQLERLLTGLLWRVRLEGHWDLLAEILLCWDIVGFERGPIYGASLRELLAKQDTAGGFPGPDAALHGNPRPTPDDGRSYVVHHYHTTLLVGLVMAQRNRLPSPDRERVPAVEIPAELRGEEGRSAAAVLTDSRAAAGARAARIRVGDSAETVAAAVLLLESTAGDAEPIAEQLRLLAAPLSAAVLGAPVGPPHVVAAVAALTAAGVAGWMLDEWLGHLETLVAGEPEGDPALFEVRRALARAVPARDVPATVSEVLADAASAVLAAPTSEALGLLAQLATNTTRGDAGVGWVTDLLEAAGGYEYRKGDLEAAARLWRAALSTTDDPALLRRIVGLLGLSQRPDGRFGYFGPEERALREMGAVQDDPWRWANVEVARTLRAAAANADLAV